MFGPLNNPKNESLPDLNDREILVFCAAGRALIFLMGVYPQPFLDASMEPRRATLTRFGRGRSRRRRDRPVGTAQLARREAAPGITAMTADHRPMRRQALCRLTGAGHRRRASMPAGRSGRHREPDRQESGSSAALGRTASRSRHHSGARRSATCDGCCRVIAGRRVRCPLDTFHGIAGRRSSCSVTMLAHRATWTATSTIGHRAASTTLLLFATVGHDADGAADDLMMVFLGIELMSIAVYVLAGSIGAAAERAAEAALKYFLLGAFSTGVLALRDRARLRRRRARPSSDEIARAAREQRRRTSPTLCSSASRCCSSASASRSRRCRSTCGRPTSTTARRRR